MAQSDAPVAQKVISLEEWAELKGQAMAYDIILKTILTVISYSGPQRAAVRAVLANMRGKMWESITSSLYARHFYEALDGTLGSLSEFAHVQT